MSGTYTNAALEGFGEDTYTSAALRGFGDETYTSAALRGFGKGKSYTTAALRGMGRRKLRKGSPEAKAYMARLRAMRGKGCGKRKRSTGRGGKKLRGGFGVLSAIGMIPTAIKAAKGIYNGIKWIVNKAKGKGAIGGTVIAGPDIALGPPGRPLQTGNQYYRSQQRKEMEKRLKEVLKRRA